MIRFTAYILILLSSLSLASAQSDGMPKSTIVHFEQLEWNFGTIKETDGKVTHSFKYTNSGKEPLLFYSVNSSCGCTTPSYRTDPLKSGQSDFFNITYDPTNRPGRFEKYVIIQGNMESGNIVLKIKGVVEQRPRGIEDDYPILLSKGLRLSDSQIDAGPVANTRETSGHVKIYNNSDNEAEFSIKTTGLPEWLKINSNGSIIPPHTSYTQTITFLPDENRWGRKSYMLPVIINGEEQPIEIYVHADYTEDFTLLSAEEREHTPYILLSSYFYSFSDCKTGENLTRDFTITNKGKGPLKIRYIDYNSEKISVKIDNTNIEVGSSVTMQIKVNSDTAEDIAEVVRIISNDPIYPVREIRIIANIN